MTQSMNGRSCIMFSRTSGEATQLNQQKAQLRQFASEHGLRILQEVDLAGTSSGSPRTAKAIDELLRRKHLANDFDALLVSNVSTLTRKGLIHGLHIMRRMAACGIAVIVGDIDGLSNFVLRQTHTQQKKKERGSIHAKEKKSDVTGHGSAGASRGDSPNQSVD